MINSTLKTTLFVNVTVYSIVLAINRVLHIEHDPFLSYLVHKNTLFNLLLDPFFQPFVLFIIYQLFIFFHFSLYSTLSNHIYLFKQS